MKDIEHRQYTLYDSPYLTFENGHIIYSGREQISDGLGPGVSWRLTRGGHKQMEVFAILIVVLVTLVETY